LESDLEIGVGSMALSKSRVVVGLDFGTTFSGFAFAHITDPEKVYTFFDYP
jgi:molecular chaperone DnaK (HSP70)